ncbi:MAG: L,D-transpeptidase [Trichloromonadaceae bacterium]
MNSEGFQSNLSLIMILGWLCLILLADPALAWYPRSEAEALLDPQTPAPVIGSNRIYVLGADETLIELAYRAGLGYEGLAAANPGIDPWLPEAGRAVLLPYEAILPAGTELGITINLAEYRLYLVWEQQGRRLVRIYPIGIGAEGVETREGRFTVTSVIADPSWTVPASIRAERPELPGTVPPGPENPLGKYWIGLSLEGIGIHGTNKPYGLGRRVSHGCIRLYPEDIEDLAARVGKGTAVRIVYQPIKLGLRGRYLLAEVHPDFLGRIDNRLEEVRRLRKGLSWGGLFDAQALQQVLAEARGIPLPVSWH